MKNNSCGLLTYFIALRHLPAVKTARNVVIPVIFSLMFSVVLVTLSADGIILSWFLAFVAFFCSVPVWWSRQCKPNMCALIPMKPGKRAAFTVLSAVMILFCMLLYLICIVLVVNCPAIIMTAVSGKGLTAYFEGFYLNGLGDVFYNAYSSLIYVFVLLYVFGAGLIYAHTDGKRLRYTVAVAMWAVAEIGAVILGFAAEGRCFGSFGANVENLAMPALAVVLVGVCALASLLAGICLTVKKCRPKTF